MKVEERERERNHLMRIIKAYKTKIKRTHELRPADFSAKHTMLTNMRLKVYNAVTVIEFYIQHSYESVDRFSVKISKPLLPLTIYLLTMTLKAYGSFGT